MLSAIASSPPTPASATAIKNIIPQLTNSPFQSYAIPNDSLAAKAFFWSLSDLENLLTEEELNVAKAAFNLKSIGNVSSLDDPSREFLRINTLGIKRDGQELAQVSGKSQSQAEDGIRDQPRSRGLGDVYKRQALSLVIVLSRSSSAWDWLFPLT